MLYELRRYDAAAGKLPALLERFGGFTVPKWKAFGIRLVGFWTPLMGEKSNQVVYMWGWDSLDDRDRRRAAMNADPEWQAYIGAIWEMAGGRSRRTWDRT